MILAVAFSDLDMCRASDVKAAAYPSAQMAELVDAPSSGGGGGNPVEVRVLFWAPCFP